MQQLKEWFDKPYPFPSSLKEKFFISLGFGKFIFIFLLLIKPFDFNHLEEKSLFFAVIFGMITFVIMFINLIVLPIILPKFFILSDWTIKHTLIVLAIIVFMVSISNWYFALISFTSLNLKYHSFLFFLFSTMVVGFFPMLIYLYISEKRTAKKYKTMAETISELKNEVNENSQETICIVGNNKNEYFNLKIENLIYISFEKNYSSIFYIKENQVQEKIIRISLTKIENQLKESSFIVRCHRSYLVNTKQVKTILGNARSYQLQLKNTNTIIPVSRSFPRELLFTLIQ